MEKRRKLTIDSHIGDIAVSFGELAATIKSISESHETLLKVNKAVVAYLQAKKENSIESQNLNNTSETIDNEI